MMRIKMISNNCECWKEGETFDIHKNADGSLFIYCNDPEAKDFGHALIDNDGEDVYDLKNNVDGEAVP